MRNLLVLLSFCFLVTNLFAQTPDPAKLKSEGDNALKAKNYAVAFTKYNQYLKQTNSKILLRLSIVACVLTVQKNMPMQPNYSMWPFKRITM